MVDKADVGEAGDGEFREDIRHELFVTAVNPGDGLEWRQR